MGTYLLLVLLETRTVHTAIQFPTYTACVEHMHESVDRVGTPLIYLPNLETYTDEAGTYVLYCEKEKY